MYTILYGLCQILLNSLDIDECDLNTDGCEQGCVNTNGSFMCNCTDGYELNGDGFSCDGKSIDTIDYVTNCDALCDTDCTARSNPGYIVYNIYGNRMYTLIIILC